MHRTPVLGAVTVLMISTALAQQPNPAPSTPSATSFPTETVNTQSSDELLASQLKGTAVFGSNDQKIGDIKDILFDKMGHVKAYIVSVGGILGIGAKEVALEQSAFQEMPRTLGRPEEKLFVVYQLKVSMTQDQLRQLAAFKPLAAPPTTTDAASGTSPPAKSGSSDGTPAETK
jgi:PRC-barrel domain